MSVLLVVGLGQPALAQEPATPLPECAAGGLTAVDEVSALGLARSCDAPVEIVSARGFDQRQHAQPDGTIRLESYARPRWAYDRSGAWVEADPTLVVDQAAGVISTVATVVDVAVSPGGSGPFVTGTAGSGASVSLTWPRELAPPVLSGATATYADVFDGVDLQVVAGVDWFSYRLVVHTPEAALNPALQNIEVSIAAVELASLEMADGSVVARDSGGEPVFSSYGALMWDSSSPEPAVPSAGLGEVEVGGDLPEAEPGRVAEVEVELAGESLWVVPDQAMLTDPETIFPVTIDPTFTSSHTAWAVVGDAEYANDTWWDDAAWPRNRGLSIGYQRVVRQVSTRPVTYESFYYRWRSMAGFDVGSLHGSMVESAELQLTVEYAGACSKRQELQLWEVAPFTQGQVPMSWTSTSGSWLGGGPLGSALVPMNENPDPPLLFYPCRNGDRSTTFDGNAIRDAVQEQADHRTGSIYLGLRAADESNILVV